MVVGACQMVQLIYQAELLLLPALLLQEDIIAAHSLMIQVLANVKTAPAQADLTGMDQNV